MYSMARKSSGDIPAHLELCDANIITNNMGLVSVVWDSELAPDNWRSVPLEVEKRAIALRTEYLSWLETRSENC